MKNASLQSDALMRSMRRGDGVESFLRRMASRCLRGCGGEDIPRGDGVRSAAQPHTVQRVKATADLRTRSSLDLLSCVLSCNLHPVDEFHK